jgi:DNA-binding NarL/FixJ family response regulator
MRRYEMVRDLSSGPSRSVDGASPLAGIGRRRDNVRVGRTVLIVDDQPEFRRLARELLERDGFVVVGEAGDACDALSAANLLQPDVVLLDVRLPDGNGVELARLMRSWPAPPAVVLTSTADYERAAVACGAHGFVPKSRISGAALRASIDGP